MPKVRPIRDPPASRTRRRWSWMIELSLVAGISYDWFDISQAEDDPDTDGNIIEVDTPGV